MEEPVIITHPVDNIPDFQMPLDKDTILDTKTRSTRNQEHISYLVARQGKTAAQATWMTTEALQHRLPQLFMEAGTLPTLNREELGQGGPLEEPPLGAPNLNS